MTPSRYLLLALLMGLSTGAFASDILKERRWVQQLEDSLVVGDPLTLTAGKQTFFAIFTEANGKSPRGGVILLHGIGAHPDWPDVISPLRQELPDLGWATLSLQMPIQPNDAKLEEYLPLFPEANERITAGIRYLQQQGIQNIVLVSHSLGSTMGAHFLAEKTSGSELVRAFVGIGMNQYPGTPAHTPDAIAKIGQPILDLYGSQDLEGVLASADDRAKAARQAKNTQYRQTRIIGADHFFRGLETTLVRQVSSWLIHVVPSKKPNTNQADKIKQPKK